MPSGAGATPSSVVPHEAQKADRENGMGYLTGMSR